MTERKGHGGPRPNSGGRRAGAGRKPRPPEDQQHGVRLWVPVENDAEAAAIRALPPLERRRRLLEEK